ncbi:MAG: rod shape-determining protein MreD [Actinomycetes bacterium]
MISLLNRPVTRLFLVGLLLLAVQTTLLTEMKFFGVIAQLLLALSITAGLSGGSESGALAGFVLGLMFDLVLTSPLGLSALVYAFAGWGAGYFHSRTLANPKWLDCVVTGVLSGVATFTLAVVANVIGIEGWLSGRLVKVIIVVGCVNALSAFFLVPISRWCLVIRRQERIAPPAELFL